MHRTSFSIAALAVCASAFLTAPVCGAVIYNASADLLANELPDGSNANPNGAWRYGTAGSVGGALTLFNATDESIGGEHSNAWNGNAAFDGYFVNDGNKVAAILVNASGAPASACCGLDNTAAGKIFAHPGPTGSRELAVVRWTAPATGLIDISAEWIKGDVGTDHLNVLQNSIGPGLLDFQLTGGRGTVKTFAQSGVSVLAGDTIDFVLGNGGTFGSNTVQFDATITYVPEPSTLALVGCSLLGLVFAVRRKR